MGFGPDPLHDHVEEGQPSVGPCNDLGRLEGFHARQYVGRSVRVAPEVAPLYSLRRAEIPLGPPVFDSSHLPGSVPDVHDELEQAEAPTAGSHADIDVRFQGEKT